MKYVIGTIVALGWLISFFCDQDPNVIMAIIPIGALIGGIGTIAGSALAAGSRGRADETVAKYMAESAEQFKSLGIPPLEAQQLALEKLKQLGLYTPEMEETVKLGDTEMRSIQLDPRFEAAQLQALTELQNRGMNKDAFSLEDQAAIEKDMAEIDARERGARDAILQNMKMRGMSGSGMELAAQLSNQQNAAQLAHERGLNTAVAARQQALNAIVGAGNLGNQMQNSQWGRESDKAQAQDLINKFNASNTQAVRGSNVDRTNAANLRNINEGQRISDTNTDIANRQQIHNKGLYQTKFDNEARRAAGISGARGGQANAATQQGQHGADLWSGIGSAVAQMGTAYDEANRQSTRWDEEKKLREQGKWGY